MLIKKIKFKSFAHVSVKNSCPPVKKVTEIPVFQSEVIWLFIYNNYKFTLSSV